MELWMFIALGVFGWLFLGYLGSAMSAAVYAGSSCYTDEYFGYWLFVLCGPFNIVSEWIYHAYLSGDGDARREEMRHPNWAWPLERLPERY